MYVLVCRAFLLDSILGVIVKLVSFSLQNYRSIKKAEKIRLGNLTILIGPNNEGKSNILRGLVAGMQVLTSPVTAVRPGLRAAASRRSGGAWTRGAGYDWVRDFPIALQNSRPDGRTVLDYEFELSPSEILEFKSQVKSALNGSLPIRLYMSQAGVEFEVRKQGRGGTTLSKKRQPIARFLAAHLSMQDIPSIRTAPSAMRLVDQMVERELRELEETAVYRDAVEQIASLQAPILNQLATTIQTMLSTFLPDVTAVHVQVEDRYQALRRDSRIVVDDGTATELQYKGDGVQSLAAIALIHHLAEQSGGTSELILAIEEPEAHLHPRAVHQLRKVLQDIAMRQQVVLTTHSPLLVNRADVSSNVIVDRSRARPARSIQEIRECLGVRISDNLAAAELVLIVEGEGDRTALTALLADSSSAIGAALREGTIAVDSLHGAANLTYRLSQLRDQLCSTHSFLDHDAAGLASAKKAEAEGVLIPADRTFATSPGMKESELEDLYDFSLYASMIQTAYNVDILKSAAFRNRNHKWKDRAKHAFTAAGQNWDASVEATLKRQVAELVALNPASALHPAWRTSFDSLVTTLETKLQQT